MARAPGVSIESNNEQTCSNAATTTVIYATANWEKPSTSWYDSTNYPHRITIQTGGLYLVTWSVFCQAGNGSGLRRAYVTVNGSAPSPLCEDRSAASSQSITLSGAVQLELNVNDYVEIQFYHNDGAPLKIGSTLSTYRNRLEVVKLSDLT